MTPFLLGCAALSWFLPLLASLIVLGLWHSKAQRLAGFLSVGISLISLTSILPLFYTTSLSETDFVAAQNWPWIELEAGEQIRIGYLIDRTGIQLLALLALLGFLIQFFSLEYMREEANQIKYYSAINLFIFSMNSLILSDGIVQSFAAWELIGLSSWLLIGYWSTQAKAATGSLRAMLFNRFADVALLSGLLILIIDSGTSSWSDLFRNSDFKLSLFPSILIIIGAAGKSAQGPLAFWLPGAMAGPTPVSALLHAATLVVAGVFLLVRLISILPDPALFLTAILGCSTLLGGGIYALQSRDIKQVLAGSTLSQLGLMFVALGTGEAQWAFLHLLTHGFFKFGLFLCVAVLSKPLHHEANPYSFDHYGGLATRRPLLFTFYLACASGLIGLPLTAGFISKELMIDSILRQPDSRWLPIQVIALASVTLTAAYITRHGYYIFLHKPKSNEIRPQKPISIYYLIPLIFVFTGCTFVWLNPTNPLDWSSLTLTSKNTQIMPHNPIHTLGLVLLTLLSVGFTYHMLRREKLLVNRFSFFDSYLLKSFESKLFRLVKLIKSVEQFIIFLTVALPVRALAGVRLGKEPERPSNSSLVGLVRFAENRIRNLLEIFLPMLLRIANKPFQRISSASLQTYLIASFFGLLALIYFLMKEISLKP